MSINIDWSSREDENITCTFRGEYNGIGFTINANWNSWVNPGFIDVRTKSDPPGKL